MPGTEDFCGTEEEFQAPATRSPWDRRSPKAGCSPKTHNPRKYLCLNTSGRVSTEPDFRFKNECYRRPNLTYNEIEEGSI